MWSQQIKCNNEPDEGEMPTIIEVTGKHRTRFSDLLEVADI